MLLKAFCRLFTAGCLEMRSEWDPPLYRRAEGVDLSLLSPDERILAESAGGCAALAYEPPVSSCSV